MSAELIANAIVAAVTAGATTGATDTAQKAVGDAYSWLKSALAKCGQRTLENAGAGGL